MALRIQFNFPYSVRTDRGILNCRTYSLRISSQIRYLLSNTYIGRFFSSLGDYRIDSPFITILICAIIINSEKYVRKKGRRKAQQHNRVYQRIENTRKGGQKEILPAHKGFSSFQNRRPYQLDNNIASQKGKAQTHQGNLPAITSQVGLRWLSREFAA